LVALREGGRKRAEDGPDPSFALLRGKGGEKEVGRLQRKQRKGATQAVSVQKGGGERQLKGERIKKKKAVLGALKEEG